MIVVAGSSFAAETVTVPATGAVTCGSGTGNLTCGGAPTPAKFHLVGPEHADVKVISPAFNLGGAGTLAVTPLVTTES